MGVCYLSWGSNEGGGSNHPLHGDLAMLETPKVVELPEISGNKAYAFVDWVHQTYLQYDGLSAVKKNGYNIATKNCAHAGASAIDFLYGENPEERKAASKLFLTPEQLYKDALIFAREAATLKIQAETFNAINPRELLEEPRSRVNSFQDHEKLAPLDEPHRPLLPEEEFTQKPVNAGEVDDILVKKKATNVIKGGLIGAGVGAAVGVGIGIIKEEVDKKGENP